MTQKEAFRKLCKSKMQNKTNYFYKHQIHHTLFEMLKILQATNILLYCPLKTEVDIFPLLYHLKKQKNYKIFIPKVTGISFDIVEFKLPLIKNKYGILESKTCAKNVKIDIAIIPVLGIDKDFRRIGFGKGMYDLFFAKLKKKPKIIFITKNLFFSKDKITQDHDIQGDYLISNFYRIKRIKNDNLFSHSLYSRLYGRNHRLFYF
ncbi:5-formyltetrahydrofolate cyclo-ligase [Helicobacter sp. faydin-H20]|uniref:5-formyltetrahydrofolate cyclo-ligase n=1 Tax=Helicobacter anatolicus TaxID=2905874 RepID=UPI001E4E3B9D|nr:5-formyltetrahydrofolate cyclo-ligase [Helicobacter anatolicus]MCE3037158.1 5-formyltetrahydrofolate cyclo-ligase [Helicobacter anatolicus]